MAIGVFDQYVNSRMLYRYPQLYKLGQDSFFYSNKTFFGMIGTCFWQSIIIYYGLSLAFGESAINQSGYTSNNWVMGEMIFTADLISITIRAAIVVTIWNKFTLFAVFGSIALWFVLFPIYGVVGPPIRVGPELQGMIPILFSSAVFWFGIILVPVAATLRDYTWKHIQRMYYPNNYHIVQEIQKYNIPDYRPRMELFRKAVHKVRLVARQKRSRGFAFSQGDSGQANLIRIYDTTRRKPKG
jgi:phospholipid-transporting ATPase